MPRDTAASYSDVQDMVEALGLMPDDAVKALREAWQEGREAFRNRFFALLGEDASFMAYAPVVLFRAIGDQLPHRLAEGAVLWALCQIAAQRSPGVPDRASMPMSSESSSPSNPISPRMTSSMTLAEAVAGAVSSSAV